MPVYWFLKILLALDQSRHKQNIQTTKNTVSTFYTLHEYILYHVFAPSFYVSDILVRFEFWVCRRINHSFCFTLFFHSLLLKSSNFTFRVKMINQPAPWIRCLNGKWKQLEIWSIRICVL